MLHGSITIPFFLPLFSPAQQKLIKQPGQTIISFFYQPPNNHIVIGPKKEKVLPLQKIKKLAFQKTPLLNSSRKKFISSKERKQVTLKNKMLADNQTLYYHSKPERQGWPCLGLNHSRVVHLHN